MLQVPGIREPLRTAAIAAVIWAAIGGTAFSQEIIKGTVLEQRAEKLQALPGVNIYWAGTTQGTVSDAQGKFSIETNSETNKLVFSFVGYRSDTQTVTSGAEVKVVLSASRELETFELISREKTTRISHLDPIKTEQIGTAELAKAACCNLSESFETNPSVDVSFTDAITGTKQIQMLGLTGNYVQVSREQIPMIRGLASGSGLTFISGSWLSSIQVSKGNGPVVNGYESIAGMINTELKKEGDEEKLFVNGYGSQDGRTELNVNTTAKTGEHVSSTTLIHGNIRPIANDMNHDGFADGPKGRQINLMNRWEIEGTKGWEAQIGITGLIDEKEGGQNVRGFHYHESPWLFTQNIGRGEVWLKTGYLFKGQEYKSVGLQSSFSMTRLDASFGATNYRGSEENGYVNLIYQSIIKDTRHKFRTGLSLLYDDLSENLNGQEFERTETVPGAFFEYTYASLGKLTAVAGIRGDYHNIYGPFFTPRLHLRYGLNEQTVLRASMGKGYRTPALFAENLSYFAGNRVLHFGSGDLDDPYGFVKQESAWTGGLSLTKDFKLDFREGVFSMDVFRTEFENQLIVDLEQTGEVHFYNLQGVSRANSLQFQLDYELFKRFDLRLAYRLNDVKSTYSGTLLEKPLVQRHRAFANAAYATRNKWKFDYTVQYHGTQRLPDTSNNPEDMRMPVNAPEFVTMNAQITKEVGIRWEFYVGGENLSNFRVAEPIISAHDPNSPYFDSALTWGPVFGRMFYGGFRFKIKR